MNTATILRGDAMAMLRTLPDNSVHCVVTSPPYYGLRDYGTATWEGGDPECDHKQGRNGAGRADGIIDDRGQRNRDGVGSMGGNCRKCGAIRIDQQIGLEDTPAEYVDRLVAVFREVRRVLRDDGVCWLNLGDSYAANRGYQIDGTMQTKGSQPNKGSSVPDGLKPKDLLGIPWRVAFALQDDGWWLRQDVIWHKPNPMPESVMDRCTKAHEYVFLLTKSARYFYDAEAVAEAATGETMRDGFRGGNGTRYVHDKAFNNHAFAVAGTGSIPNVSTRNRRSVWTIATEPTPYAHFATMPSELAETCILAGCPGDGTVLDPFAGSGTTLRVALTLGRNAIGIELNSEYAALAEQLIAQTQPALLPL